MSDPQALGLAAAAKAQVSSYAGVLSALLFTGIPGVAIPAPMQEIRTAGYSQAGLGEATYCSTSNTGATAFRTQSLDGRWWELAEPELDPTMIGAKADGVVFNDASCLGALNSITHNKLTRPFTSGDVGKAYVLTGQGVSGADLVTTIASVVSANTITLAANVAANFGSSAGTYASGEFGSDDAPLINAAILLSGMSQNAYDWNIAFPTLKHNTQQANWWGFGNRKVVLRAGRGRINARYCIASPVRLANSTTLSWTFGAQLAALPNFAGEAMIHQQVGWSVASVTAVASGGTSGYVVGDALKDASADSAGGGVARFLVSAVSGGVVTGVTIVNKGAYTADIAGTLTLAVPSGRVGAVSLTVTSTRVGAALDLADAYLENPLIVATGYADKCIWFQRGQRVGIKGESRLLGGVSRGLKIGDDLATRTDTNSRLIVYRGDGDLYMETVSANPSFAGVTSSTPQYAQIGTSNPAGVGMDFCGNATDNFHTGNVEVVGYYVGFKDRGGNNGIAGKAHAWSSRAAGYMYACFDLAGSGTHIFKAMCDSPWNAAGQPCYGVIIGGTGRIDFVDSTVNFPSVPQYDNSWTLIKNNLSSGSAGFDIGSLTAQTYTSSCKIAKVVDNSAGNAALLRIDHISTDGNYYSLGYADPLTAINNSIATINSTTANLQSEIDTINTVLPGALWTPAQLGSQVVRWYDAQKISTLTVNGSNQVTSWADRSPSGYAATVATQLGITGTAPTYSATGWDGTRACVIFDGAPNGNILDLGILGASDLTVIMVLERLPDGNTDSNTRRPILHLNNYYSGSLSAPSCQPQLDFYNAQTLATFQATISGTLMTQTGALSGNPLVLPPGYIAPAANGAGVTASTTILSLASGTVGQVGATYNLSQSSTVATATTMTIGGQNDTAQTSVRVQVNGGNAPNLTTLAVHQKGMLEAFFTSTFTPAEATGLGFEGVLYNATTGLKTNTVTNPLVASASPSTKSTLGGGDSTYGAGVSQPNRAAFKLIELIILGGLVTTAQRQLCEGYAIWHAFNSGAAGGLQNTHPYYGAAPTIGAVQGYPLPSVRVTAGATSGSPYAIPTTAPALIVRVKKATPSASYLTINTSALNDGATFLIKDSANNATTYPITITPSSGTIDGAASYAISVSNGKVELVWDAANSNFDVMQT